MGESQEQFERLQNEVATLSENVMTNILVQVEDLNSSRMEKFSNRTKEEMDNVLLPLASTARRNSTVVESFSMKPLKFETMSPKVELKSPMETPNSNSGNAHNSFATTQNEPSTLAGRKV